MPDIQITDIQIGDIVKYNTYQSWVAPIEGVWLVINMDPRMARGTEYVTLKKGSNTRYSHISHLKKV